MKCQTSSNTDSKSRTRCRECHKRKVKCSGNGPPCTACSQARVECCYPARDKQIKVGQRYLDNVLEENRRLSALVSAGNTPATAPLPSAAASEHTTPRADNADRNPVLEDHPWFMVHEAVDLPIYINETADAAFATRLRQTASTTPVNHLARVQYVEDDTLRYLSESSSQPNWPSSSRLKFLVNTAMETACKTWHIVRKSRIDKDVEALLQDPGSCHWLNASRIWALMAIGDAFSSRCTLPDQPFPGSKYWARAMQLVHMTMERPRLCLVEVYLLLVGVSHS